MKKIISLIVTGVILGGCASSTTSTALNALPTKVINSEMAKSCTFIGVVSGHVYSGFQSASDNIADARMKAAKEALRSGANAVVITSTDVEDPGHNVTVNMDTYTCPDSK